MKKIKAIVRLLKNYARNGEHYRYHADVMNIITPAIAEKYKISLIYSPYVSLFGDEKSVYKQNMKFDLTEEIESKDHIRDELFIYLKGIIDGNLHCPIEAKKTAAKNLDYALSPYKNANELPYAENTSEIENAIEELKSEKFASSVTELGLDDAVAQLEAANLDFNETYISRSDEKRLRNERVSMKTLRPQVDEAYLAVVNAINALYMANEIATKNEETREELGTVIDKVNSLITQLEETLGRRGAKSDSDEEEEPEPTPAPKPEPAITSVYNVEGRDPEKPLFFWRTDHVGMGFQGFTLKGQGDTLEHVIGLVEEYDRFTEWIKPEAISNVTETSCQFAMVEDLASGKYKIRIETYDGGSPLVVEYPDLITLD